MDFGFFNKIGDMGFTLMEFTVVFVISAALAAIGLVCLGMIREFLM